VTKKALLIVVVAFVWTSIAQESTVALPMVAGAAVPLYPPLARAASVQGVVHVNITTDGHRVVAARIVDGNKLLAAAAESNVRTWTFSLHEPTVFVVTYNYKLVTKWAGDPNNPEVVLQLPTKIEISTKRWPGTVDMPTETKPGKAQ
jgi:hypothetical protein